MSQASLPTSIVRSRSHLGVAIRRMRKLLGLTQTDLAKKTGLTQATISNIERAQSSADMDTIFLILSALNLDLALIPRPSFQEGAAGFEGLF